MKASGDNGGFEWDPTDDFPETVRQVYKLGYVAIPQDAERRPLIKWGEFQDRRPSEEEMASWPVSRAKTWAVVLGKRYDLIALDLDGKAGRELKKRHRLEPNVRTRSGGFHVWISGVRVPIKQETDVRGWPGLTLKGEGGLATFYGDSGNGEYRLLQFEPTNANALSADLRKVLLAHERTEHDRRMEEQRGVGGQGSRIGVATHLFSRAATWLEEGSRPGWQNRNQAGFNLLCQMRDNGVPQDVAEMFIPTWVAAANRILPKPGEIPYTEDHIHDSLEQVYEVGAVRDPSVAPLASTDSRVDAEYERGLARALAQDLVKEEVARRKVAEADDTLRKVLERFKQFALLDSAPDFYDEALTDEDVAALPPVEFLIDGFLPERGYAVLYGKPGVGKTLFLIDVMERVRRGMPLFDRKAKRCGAVVFEGEGLLEFKPRKDAWRERWVKDDEEDDPAPGMHLDVPLDLTRPESVASVIRTVRRQEQATGVPVGLVIIEPIAESIAGDENGEAMVLASNGLRAIATILGCCVLVAHHTNAAGERERGNEHLRMRAHTMMVVEEIDADGEVGLLVNKQRNAENVAMKFLRSPQGPSVVLEPEVEMTRTAYEQEKDSRAGAAQGHKQEARKRAREEARVPNADRAREVLLTAIKENPSSSTRDLIGADGYAVGLGVGTVELRKGLKALLSEPDSPVVTEPGPRNAVMHYLKGAI